MRIYYAECDDCHWTWEASRRYTCCQNCGLTNITVWETQEQLERKTTKKSHRARQRRLSDTK